MAERKGQVVWGWSTLTYMSSVIERERVRGFFNDHDSLNVLNHRLFVSILCTIYVIPVNHLKAFIYYLFF